MCAKYSNHLKAVHGWTKLLGDMPRDKACGLISPADEVAVVTQEGIEIKRWGLVPSWAEGESSKANTWNARIETVEDKPTFRSAWNKKQRCLVPAHGYYEWKQVNGVRVPHYAQLKDDSPVVFAGLWDRLKKPNFKVVDSYTILTTQPVEELRELHSRMPVMISSSYANDWLNCPNDEANDILNEAVPKGLIYYRTEPLKYCTNGPIRATATQNTLF